MGKMLCFKNIQVLNYFKSKNSKYSMHYNQTIIKEIKLYITIHSYKMTNLNLNLKLLSL